jgi:hypothetical protein
MTPPEPAAALTGTDGDGVGSAGTRHAGDGSVLHATGFFMLRILA